MRKNTESGRASCKRSARSHVYAFDDFTLDVAARNLLRGGTATVRCRRAHSTALVYLIERRERLVQKNELIDAIWHDVVVTDDSLIARDLRPAPRARRRAGALRNTFETSRAAATVSSAPSRIADPAAQLAAPTHARSTEPDVRRERRPHHRRLAGRDAAVRCSAASPLRRPQPSRSDRALSSRRQRASRNHPRRACTEPCACPNHRRRARPSCRAACCRRTADIAPSSRATTSAAATALWLRSLQSSAARAPRANRRRIEAVLGTRLAPHRLFCERQAHDGRHRDGNVREVASVGVSPPAALGRRTTRSCLRTGRRGSTQSALPVPRRDLVAAKLDRDAQDIAFAWPQFLPDGRRFLYQIVSLDPARTRRLRRRLDTRRKLPTARQRFGGGVRAAAPRAVRPAQHADCGGVRREHLSAHRSRGGRCSAASRRPRSRRDNVVSAAGDLSPTATASGQQHLAWFDRAGDRTQHAAAADHAVQSAGLARRLAAPRDERGDDQSRASGSRT